AGARRGRRYHLRHRVLAGSRRGQGHARRDDRVRTPRLMGLLSRRLVVPLTALLFLLEATPALAEGPSSARPTHIQADTLVYSKETQTYEGKGSVVVVQGPYRLEADEATLNVATGQVTAVGRAHLNDGESDIRGERLAFNITTTKGVTFHGRHSDVEGNYEVDAQLTERISE